jgi:hypothetical protein
MIAARGLFYLSLVATLWMSFGLTVKDTGEGFWPWLALAMVVAFLATSALVLMWPGFLTVAPAARGRFASRTAVWSVVSYVGGTIGIIVLAYLLMPPNYLNTEAALTAYILALWLPLWFAPAVGLVLGWWGMRSNSTIESDARKSSARPSS